MKIVVPIMPRSMEDVEALDMGRLAAADLIEWRADYLPKEDILRVAPAVFEKLVGREIIFTLRTSREGGLLDISDADYIEIMSELTSFSPAVVKMAVMPKTEQDVLDVMNYTRGFKTLNMEQSYATMSMGNLGKLSRLAGVLTGSCWSFASLDEASAPGQISLTNMKKFLEELEN